MLPPEFVEILRIVAHMVHLPYDVLYDRLVNLMWDIDVALVVPDTESLSLMFMGVNGKAYYKAPWSTVEVTARQIIEHYKPHLLDSYDATSPTGEYTPFISRK